VTDNVKSKILIVEDDLDVAEMLNAYFLAQEFDVFTVNWGEDGVRACQTFNPDLALLDIRLPDIDGYEVARRMRTDRRTQDIPVIFLTDKSDHSDRLHGLELGADDYITKPFDIQELRLRVRNALRRTGQGSLTNPISGLPDGTLVDEQLSQALQKNEFIFILVSLTHLDAFRDAYGFVASDDVMRAVSLMMQTALREVGGADHFIGHLTPTDFVIIVPAGIASALKERVLTRLEQSLEYFYPIKDRDQAASRSDRLIIRLAEAHSMGERLTSVEALKKELIHLIR